MHLQFAKYDKDTPERWYNVAKAVGGKSEDDVKRHCQILLEDLRHIESGHVPIPIYKSTPTTFPLSTTRTGNNLRRSTSNHFAPFDDNSFHSVACFISCKL
ncbi:hypothetical protein JHK82_014064 [Glycine max]|nr:hypothetical protein JHK85_014437 [Glycine max]KAG5044683.1 hypothetical protein JHK86_014089 [Glycine max]KAG5147183.1 hypothetical protein JHK82_014064 [Glycine max]